METATPIKRNRPLSGFFRPETNASTRKDEPRAPTKPQIVDKIDHRNLNMDVDFLKGKMTSCENLVKEFWDILAEPIATNSSGKLYKITLQETHKNYVEYFGE